MSLAVLIIGQLLINRYYLGDEAIDADVDAVGPILWIRHCIMFSGFVLCLSLSQRWHVRICMVARTKETEIWPCILFLSLRSFGSVCPLQRWLVVYIESL